LQIKYTPTATIIIEFLIAFKCSHNKKKKLSTKSHFSMTGITVVWLIDNGALLTIHVCHVAI